MNSKLACHDKSFLFSSGICYTKGASHLTVQRQALRAAGCGVIRAEKASGSRRDGRSELQVLLDFVQPCHTLVVTRIDRLARSLKDLQDIVNELNGRSVTLRATEQPVDTGTAAG